MIVRDFSKCPRCGSPTRQCKSFGGPPSQFWVECTNHSCNTYINTYVPQPHQMEFHTDTHLITGNFGGYGSGKTVTSREETEKHIFITPNGTTLIGANVQSQYEQTIKRDLENDIPEAFVAEFSTQKQFIDFINGHRILFRPFDDPDKLRSYNLTSFVMIEASECKKESFTQLKTRLRNMAAGVQAKDRNGNPKYIIGKNHQQIPVMQADWRRGIIESNPDSGWIRSDVVLKSSAIQKHGKIPDRLAVLNEDMDPYISSHITTSEVNQYLPDNFVETNAKGKSIWWVNKYLYGSFMFAAGLVYPNALNYICDNFEIPKHWKRVVAFDYGLADDSVYLFAAIDEEHNLVYIYDTVVTNDKSVEQLARLYFESIRGIPSGGFVCSPIIDPKSGPKRDYEKKTLADHFMDYGIAFKPGAINKEARMFRVNTYIELGYLRIMEKNTYLINQLREYKFASERGDAMAFTDKPMDHKDHAIVCLEWILMELPPDPRNLVYGIYNRNGEDLTLLNKKNRDMSYAEYALSDPSDQDYYMPATPENVSMDGEYEDNTDYYNSPSYSDNNFYNY